MNTDINNITNFRKQLETLKQAYYDCIDHQVATYETAKKYAPLCVQIVKEYKAACGHLPRLINNRIQNRILATDGRSVFEEDFWSDENMVISLFDHLSDEFEIDPRRNA